MLCSLFGRRTGFGLPLLVLFAAVSITFVSPSRLSASDSFSRVSKSKTFFAGIAGGSRIVFGSVRNGDNDIYAMDLDGSNQTRLTTSPAYDDQPKWSPDGNKIVFMSDRSGNFEVYCMNADGSNQTRLTNNPGADGFPVWSPDGTKIAFVNGDLRNPNTFEIYSMNADGSNRTRLTDDSQIDGVPAWSPDGTRIVFMSGGPSLFDPNSFEIFQMNADGSNRIRLTNNQVVDGQPSFSPDGTKILFASGETMNPNGIEIYVMNADGSNRTKLTDNTVTDGFPAWSPDGTKIIFASGDIFDEATVELFVMNADGSSRTRLTNNSSLDWFADWQPAVQPPWQPAVLAANQIELKVWTLQGRSYAYVKTQFPNAGYRIVNWGQVGQSGNDFTVDASVERFIGLSIQSVVTTTQIYDLGPLANGTYNFNFKTSGTLAKTLQFTISSVVPPPNPIDNAREFVKQHYRDFLNREADQAGEDFWTDNITKCSDPARRPAGQTEAQCTLRQRETTSGAFFLSPEFQYTSYFVYRMYQGALGRQPKLSEFTPDALFVANGIIVNGQLSAAKINQNKADFALQFIDCTDATKYRCAEFKSIYDGLNNQQYVDKLFQTTGVNAGASDRASLVNMLNANPAPTTRASVLQKVVDGINVISEGNQQFTTTYGQAFYNQQFTRAFVQLEYFGYMKRDPDEAGYEFWLGKLNQFGGNFVNAEMVLAFISSPEYRARFGAP
jgi:Tol biopolymer transport system component